MIFVTIGSQEPFDRLIKIMDDLAPSLSSVEVIAQSGPRSKYIPRHLKMVEFIPPEAFSKFLSEADLIISHAGMGTILNVLEIGKPLIVFPRLGRLHETRDDHQVATVKIFERKGLVHVANNEEEMQEKILSFFEGNIKPAPKIPPFASTELLASLREFIK
jgi:UDP-N-acetylglucosamine transferase subunit ALG13